MEKINVKFSIIIPVFNKIKYTQGCLNAIRKNTDLKNVEIIVIDNNSSDGSGKFLKSQDDIITILNKENHNFAGANNQGAKIAKGHILVFLNNDTKVHKGWLDSIENIFDKENKVGAVGVKLLFPNGRIQHVGVVISEDRIPRHIHYNKNPKEGFGNKKRKFKAVTAACIAISTEVYVKLGGFDESYKNGLEDIDLCLKIYHAGNNIFYTPDSVVTHYESVSPGRFKYNIDNGELYMSRWRNEKSDEHKYLQEDGLSQLQILKLDLRNMSFGEDIFHTRPLRIKILRGIYILIRKPYIFIKLLLSGDFIEIKRRIRNRYAKS